MKVIAAQSSPNLKELASTVTQAVLKSVVTEGGGARASE